LHLHSLSPHQQGRRAKADARIQPTRVAAGTRHAAIGQASPPEGEVKEAFDRMLAFLKKHLAA
jgi:hypothetical protein